MSSTSRPFNPFVSLGMAVDASVGAFRSLGQSFISMQGRNAASATRGHKAPNPAGTKLARKARERKLGLRWC